MNDDELHNLIEVQGQYHKVDDPRIMEAMGKAREDMMATAHRIVDVMPECEERVIAVSAILNTALPMTIGGLARYQEQTLLKWGQTTRHYEEGNR